MYKPNQQTKYKMQTAHVVKSWAPEIAFFEFMLYRMSLIFHLLETIYDVVLDVACCYNYLNQFLWKN